MLTLRTRGIWSGWRVDKEPSMKSHVEVEIGTLVCEEIHKHGE